MTFFNDLDISLLVMLSEFQTTAPSAMFPAESDVQNRMIRVAVNSPGWVLWQLTGFSRRYRSLRLVLIDCSIVVRLTGDQSWLNLYWLRRVGRCNKRTLSWPICIKQKSSRRKIRQGPIGWLSQKRTTKRCSARFCERGSSPH